jgi:dTDP-4-dehydrorhamnose reductase
MNILVFGKDGQLGKAFQTAISAKSLDRIHRIHFAGRAQCDLSNEEALTVFLHDNKPNLIINAAAYTAVDQAEREVDLAFAINAKAPEIMAHYAAKEGATLLHYSTDYVFDGSKATPYVESDARNPLGIYGKSKAAGEEAIEVVFSNEPNPQACFAIFRTSWIYGDGDNFIRTILRLAKEHETIKVIANQYGVPTSATWLANISLDALFNKANQLRTLPCRIYHAVPQGETTWHELACFAVEVAHDAGEDLKLHPDQIVAIPVSEYPLPAPRPMNSRLLRTSLDNLMNQILSNSDDVTKFGQWQQSWEESVESYVRSLVLHKLI